MRPSSSADDVAAMAEAAVSPRKPRGGKRGRVEGSDEDAQPQREGSFAFAPFATSNGVDNEAGR
jgi:hypothetical protein